MKKLRIGDTVRFWEGSVIVTGKNIEKLERWRSGEEERKKGEVEEMIKEVKEEVREWKRRRGKEWGGEVKDVQ